MYLRGLTRAVPVVGGVFLALAVVLAILPHLKAENSPGIKGGADMKQASLLQTGKKVIGDVSLSPEGPQRVLLRLHVNDGTLPLHQIDFSSRKPDASTS